MTNDLNLTDCQEAVLTTLNGTPRSSWKHGLGLEDLTLQLSDEFSANRVKLSVRSLRKDGLIELASLSWGWVYWLTDRGANAAESLRIEMAMAATVPTPTIQPRPYTRSQVDPLTKQQLKDLCRPAAKAEGLRTTWIDFATMDERRAWLTSPVGTPPPASIRSTYKGSKIKGTATKVSSGGSSSHTKSTLLRPISAPAPTPSPAPAAPAMAATDGLTPAMIEEIKRLLRSYTPAPAPAKGVDPVVLREAVLGALEEISKEKPQAVRKAGTVAIEKLVTMKSEVLQKLAIYCKAGAAFMPLLIKGPAGSGKTTEARMHGTKGFDCFIEYQAQGNDGESIDMLGSVEGTTNAAGKMTFVWTDGKVTEAFRRASRGENVCLLIDEIFRLRKVERDAMLSALAPTLDGHYVLTTSRTIIDPADPTLARKETIQAPVEKLAIIATTNCGSDYGLEEPCFAERARWHEVYAPTNWDTTKDILSGYAAAYGWSDPKLVAEKLVILGQATHLAQQSGELEIGACTRTLSRALKNPLCIADSWATLRGALLEEARVWVARDDDGNFNAKQFEACRIKVEDIVKADATTHAVPTSN
jgi:hypothetical protein